MYAGARAKYIAAGLERTTRAKEAWKASRGCAMNIAIDPASITITLLYDRKPTRLTGEGELRDRSIAAGCVVLQHATNLD